MTRTRIAAAMAAALMAGSSSSLHADVRADEKAKTDFAGALGTMVHIFGGKAAREGVTMTIAVKGDRKASINESTGKIIDLSEEKIYDLDMHKKTYKVTTFDELRKQMADAEAKARESASKQQPEPKTEPKEQKPQKEMQIDFDVKDTGQKKTINGYDTHEVIMTISIHEKGKTLEQAGGMIMTTDAWMGPKIAAMKEIADFDRRYFEKLNGPMVGTASPEQMAAAMAMYPTMKDAIKRQSNESGKMDGTAILQTTTMDSVKSPEQMAEEQKQSDDDTKSSASGGIGGMMGAFGKKVAKKKTEGEPKARNTFMTLETEVLKVTTDVAPADVSIPAGFKENK